MRGRFQNFMEGRHGGDQLNTFLCIVALILIVLNFIFTSTWVLWVIGVALLVVIYLRMLSRNEARRSRENDIFMGFLSRFRRGGGSSGGRGYSGGRGGSSYGAGRSGKEKLDKRNYKYFTCPNCNQKVRVPKGRGKIEITCPKCRTSFIRRS